jgi:hypothetical protein
MLRPESSAVLTKGTTEVRTGLIDQIRIVCPENLRPMPSGTPERSWRCSTG